MSIKRLYNLLFALLFGFLGLIAAIFLLSTGNNDGVVFAQGNDGHAVYYVSADGACGGQTPCYTIVQDAVDAADDPDDEIRVSTGIYSDVNSYGGYPQVLYISKTLTIRGGYSTTNWITPTSSLYTTTLSGEDNNRVVIIGGSSSANEINITVTVEGFEIANGRVSSHGPGVYIRYIPSGNVELIGNRIHHNVGANTNSRGGGVFVYESPNVLLQDNEIYNNILTHYSLGAGVGVIDSPGTQLIGNRIYSNQASDSKYCEGGGVYISNSSNSVVQNNDIYQNSINVNVSHSGDRIARGGGGLNVRGSDDVTVVNNRIYSNTTHVSGNQIGADGGGVTIRYSSRISFTQNSIYGNVVSRSDSGESGSGAGLYAYDTDSGVFTHNDIYSNTATDRWGGAAFAESNYVTFDNNDVYGNEAQNGEAGGLYTENIYSSVFRNNLIHHNTASGSGGGMVLQGGTNSVEGNQIYANHTNAHGGGISLGGSNQEVLANDIYSNTAVSSAGGLVLTDRGHTLTNNRIYDNSAGYAGGMRVYHSSSATNPQVTFINNVIAGNTATSGNGGGLAVSGGATNINFWHTTLADNHGPNIIYVYSDGTTAAFTNTLIYSGSVGAAVDSGSSASATMNFTLWDSVSMQTSGAVTSFADITGTAAFDADGYHLTINSDAIDQGVDTNITNDIDGQSRPSGDAPDIGADEYPYHVDLAISKMRQGSGAASSGEVLTYTLMITNAAVSEIMADALVVDTVEPASAVAAMSVNAPGNDCTTAGATITCALHNIPTDTMRLMTVLVTTTSTYDGILTNTATVTPANALETNPADNTAVPVTTTIIYVPPIPDLWVNKAAPAYAQPSETAVYTVTWGNGGSLMADNSVLTDTLPDGVTFVSADPPQTSGPAPLVWNLGNIAPDQQGTITITTQVNAGLTDGTVLTNTAVITTESTENETGNNTAVAATTIYQLGGYDLALNKAIIGGGGTYEYGEEVYYQISISNTGQLAADIDMLDEIPDGTAYIADSVQANGDGTTSSLTDDNGQIRWLGDMGAGGAEIVSFGVTVVSPQGVDCGTIRNEATAIIPGVSYQWASQIDFHVLSPDLGVSINAPQYAARESESVMDAYTITVTYQNDDNHLYPGSAYTAVLTVTLPNNNALLWESFPPPTQQNSGQEWGWNLGEVVTGEEQSIEITIQPSPATAGSDYLVRAEIDSPTPECCQPNQPETADAHTYMVDMHFQKSAAATKQYWGTDTAGNIISHITQEYYLQFQHQNADPNAPSASYTVMDMLPDAFTFDTAASNPAMEIEDFAFYINFNALQPFHTNDSAWIRLKTNAEDLQAGDTYSNSASLGYEINGQALEARAEAVSVVPIAPPLVTFPGDGELCGNDFGQVEISGTAQSGTVVKLFEDAGSGFEESAATTADLDGSFSFLSTNIIPEGLTETLKIYTQACNPADTNDCSALSNEVEIWETQGNWCPQRSYWEGTLQSGPLQGQYYKLDGFRNDDGHYSTVDWESPGLFGFWDTDLYLYACCNSTVDMVVTADGIEYQPVDVNGKWHHFHIDRAHDVEICSACGGEEPVCTDGDILIDPDGFVFDVDAGGDYDEETGMFAPVQAISGVTVTCMISMPNAGGWVPWPAHLYENQVNPQVTDDVYPDGIMTTGYYAFFTPPGFYYIQVEGIPSTGSGQVGYQEWRSPVVQVITEIVHVNVPYTMWSEETAVTVTTTSDGLVPSVITVPMGSAVTWVSALTATETITDLMRWSENPLLRPLSDLNPLENTRGWDAGYLEPGGIFQRQFDTPGTYTYSDAAGHMGQVIVIDTRPTIYLPIIMR